MEREREEGLEKMRWRGTGNEGSVGEVHVQVQVPCRGGGLVAGEGEGGKEGEQLLTMWCTVGVSGVALSVV